MYSQFPLNFIGNTYEIHISPAPQAGKGVRR